MLFAISHTTPDEAAPASVVWQPSGLTVTQNWSGLQLRERKFITWNDCAVSLQSWRNDRDESVELRIDIDPEWMTYEGSGAHGEHELPGRAGLRIRSSIAASDSRLWTGLQLAPGERIDLAVAASVGLHSQDTFEELESRARRHIGRHNDRTATDHIKSYTDWFAATPSFHSSNALLDQTWHYRWFLLRHNLANPGIGQLSGSVVYEGRSHKMSKEPWNPKGWEFSKLIPLSSPLQLLDARWYQDPALGAGILESAAATQGTDGQLYSRTVDETMHHYCNFLGWAAARFAQVHGVQAAEAVLPVLKRQVRSERELRTPGSDGLPVQTEHQRTGKEYQPSYWYFHGFPDDPKDPATYTPLKRVDQAIYQHLNAAGVSLLCGLLADPDAGEFRAIATETAEAILSKQWDPETNFFYDLHHRTDEKALVRNVVGLYPWWAGITGAEHLDGFMAAFAADGFGSPWPLPSVSVDSPAFAPAGGWNGQFLKGRNGCMWNGPTWPYTNSIALDAVGRTSQANDHRFDELFADLLRKFCLLHFHQHDGHTPYLVEHYDSLTGEPISDEPDYLHSYLIDLIVRYVAGVHVADDQIVLDPIDIGLAHFQLSDLPAAGHRIGVSYRRSGPDAGLRLIVDGSEVAHTTGLTVLRHSL